VEEREWERKADDIEEKERQQGDWCGGRGAIRGDMIGEEEGMGMGKGRKTGEGRMKGF
jgi:hypothetical protein